MEERLQKILASAGVGSRRTCEELIKSGRVTINRAVAEIGQKADPQKDKIAVDGRVVKPAEAKIYIALNKRRYCLSTVETERGDTRLTVRDLIPMSERLYPVGRLDFESEGLILMTNDGELAQKLQHPRYEHEKEYRVLVARHPDQEQLSAWRRGIVLEDGFKTRPADVKIEKESGKGMWLRVTLKEGHKRQIREMGAKTALPVVRIIRIRMGSLHLGNLRPREWRPLTELEVSGLKGGLPKPSHQNPRMVHRKKVVNSPGKIKKKKT